VTALGRLVLAAIDLEKKRAADGTYPMPGGLEIESIGLPVDPSSGKKAVYTRSADGKRWGLSLGRLVFSR
jgi:hypothetical protein